MDQFSDRIDFQQILWIQERLEVQVIAMIIADKLATKNIFCINLDKKNIVCINLDNY